MRTGIVTRALELLAAPLRRPRKPQSLLAGSPCSCRVTRALCGVLVPGRLLQRSPAFPAPRDSCGQSDGRACARVWATFAAPPCTLGARGGTSLNQEAHLCGCLLPRSDCPPWSAALFLPFRVPR